MIKTLQSRPGADNASLYLGKDGGLRFVSDETHQVVSAIGLNNDQIQRFTRSLPHTQQQLQEIQGRDGSQLSHDALYHPAEGVLPREWTEQEKASAVEAVDMQTTYMQGVQDRDNLTQQELLGLLEVQNQGYRDNIAHALPDMVEIYQRQISNNEDKMRNIREQLAGDTAQN